MKENFGRWFYLPPVGAVLTLSCDSAPIRDDEPVCEELPFSELTGIGDNIPTTREILEDYDVWHDLFVWSLGSCVYDEDLPDYDCQCETQFDEADWGTYPDPDIYECNDWHGDVVPCEVQRCTVEMQVLVALSMATDLTHPSYRRLCHDLAADSDRLFACTLVTYDYFSSCYHPKGRVHQERLIGAAATP